jgi:hypothetical protein
MRATRLLLVLLMASACGPTAVEDGATRCLSLSEPAGGPGLLTSAPSRVSLFFKIDTCQGAPVSGLDASAFELQEDGSPVSRYESQQKIQPRGQSYRLDSVVLLDISGSVLRSGAFSALQAAAGKYIAAVLDATSSGQRIALLTFDGRAAPQVVVDFSANQAALLAGLSSLGTVECRSSSECAGFSDRRTCAGWRCVDDSTNLNGAVVSSLELLEAHLADASVPYRDAALVLFTDGTDQASRVSSAEASSRAAKTPVHLFSVGLGEEADAAALATFGRDGTFPATSADGLASAFEAVASRVNALANRFYLLEYCSPKRGGAHTLKVVASSQQGATLYQGGLSLPFDATGFASGCEL